MNKRAAAWSVIIICFALAISGLIYAQDPAGLEPGAAELPDVVEEAAPDGAEPEPEAITAYVRERNYHEYLARFPNAARPDVTIVIPAVEYSSSDMELSTVSGLGGYDREVLLTRESGYVEWAFEVPQAGLYNIAIEYYPMPGRGVDIERELWINGERPFNNAQYLEFNRVWGDEGPFLVDSFGNQIRSRQVEKPMWIYKAVQDQSAMSRNRTCSISRKE